MANGLMILTQTMVMIPLVKDVAEPRPRVKSIKKNSTANSWKIENGIYVMAINI